MVLQPLRLSCAGHGHRGSQPSGTGTRPAPQPPPGQTGETEEEEDAVAAHRCDGCCGGRCRGDASRQHGCDAPDVGPPVASGFSAAECSWVAPVAVALPGQSRARAAVTVQWHPEVLPGKSGCVAAHEASEPPVAAERTWVLRGRCPAPPASPWEALPFISGGRQGGGFAVNLL